MLTSHRDDCRRICACPLRHLKITFWWWRQVIEEEYSRSRSQELASSSFAFSSDMCFMRIQSTVFRRVVRVCINYLCTWPLKRYVFFVVELWTLAVQCTIVVETCYVSSSRLHNWILERVSSCKPERALFEHQGMYESLALTSSANRLCTTTSTCA